MLLKLHTNIFVVGLLTFGFMAVMVTAKSFSLMTLASLVGFVTQMALLSYFSHEDKADYSERALILTVFIYTLLLGFFYIMLSEYYDGDNFLFSKADAMYYFKQCMKVRELGLIGNLSRIISDIDYDDWGTLVFDTIVMYIVPDKLFLNLIYTLIGCLSALFLFRIGKSYMPDSYAFLAVLGYSCSSYMVFFNCSFLKESLFVYFVIAALYYQNCAIQSKSNKYLYLLVLNVVMIFFFRPAVAAFVAASSFVYYGITQKGKAISLFLYVGAIGAFIVSLKTIQEILEFNTAGGDLDAVIEETNNGAYSGGFNYFVSLFGAFFGPFPSLFPKIQGPSYLEFLGAGLVYKLFLVGPFWYGIWMIWKNKVIELIPIVLFVLLELVLTGAVCASLELRKVLLHVPFMYIIAFYGLYKGFVPDSLTRISSFACYAFAIGVLFLWNVIKADNL